MKWKVIRIICQEVFLDEVKVMANVCYLQYFEILTQVLRYNTGRAIWPKNSRLDQLRNLTPPISFAAPRCCKSLN